MKTFADFGIHVGKIVDDACSEWQGSFFSKNKRHLGYGRIYVNGKTWVAHRYIWTLNFGDIPKGMLVCHHCDNARCVKLEHLFLGSHRDNFADARLKKRIAVGDRHGTHTHPESVRKREAHHSAKLTMKLADEIRSIAKSRMGPGRRFGRKQLAEQFSVSESLIKQVVSGGRWL